jgi:signal transduction histidine kinase
MLRVTELDDLRSRLAQAEAALQQCERLAVANRYAGAIMHEVNNPLAAITNLVFLTKLNSVDPVKVLEYMSVIEGQLANLTEVTNQVLAFHREQHSAKDFDLIGIVESALKLHQARLASGEVALVRDFRLPATASVFGSELLQVLSNLLLNSLDALPERNAQLRIRVRAVRGAVHITVSDNGTGMTPDVRKTLFQPYKTTKETGTGLGLWLSKRIVDKHNGKLRVRSSQAGGRRGTTFRLSIPLMFAT